MSEAVFQKLESKLSSGFSQLGSQLQFMESRLGNKVNCLGDRLGRLEQTYTRSYSALLVGQAPER